jgi:hypothetical protein
MASKAIKEVKVERVKNNKGKPGKKMVGGGP